MDIFVAVKLLQQSCSTFKEVRGQTLTHSTGLDPLFFGPHSPGLIFFFSCFNFLHPLTESDSLHSSLTKHKLQYFRWRGGGQMCGGDARTIRFQFAGNGKHDMCVFVVRMRQKMSVSAVTVFKTRKLKGQRGEMDDGRISEVKVAEGFSP